jgi:hypothetical protein
MCYGYSAEIRDEVIDYLDFREKDGYDRESVDVHLRMEGAPDGTCRPEPSLHGAARDWLQACWCTWPPTTIHSTSGR